MQLATASSCRPPHRRRPPLWPATERRLVLAARAGSDEARLDLIEAFRPQMAGIARMYAGAATIDRAELMQEGVVGLLRALDRFDPELGTPFWAYASWWVRQAMQQLVSELTRPVVLSDRALRQLAKLKYAQRHHVQVHHAEPTSAQLGAATGLSVEQVDRLMVAEMCARALDEPLNAADGGIGILAEQLADPRAEDAYEEVSTRLLGRELPGLIDMLSDRERKIVRARFGFDGGERSLQDLGTSLGVTAERIRQIESRAIGKLRHSATHH
jgi:RNA polymerase sigma factor (sigma-70 family)